MKHLQAGEKTTVDGWPATVYCKRGDHVYVSWFVGEPLRNAAGRILGWSAEKTKNEWIPLSDPRIGT